VDSLQITKININSFMEIAEKLKMRVNKESLINELNEEDLLNIDDFSLLDYAAYLIRELNGHK